MTSEEIPTAILTGHRLRVANLRAELDQLERELGIEPVELAKPSDLVGLADIATDNEVDVAIVRSWKARGQLPAPWATVGRTPVWLRRQFEGWTRPGVVTCPACGDVLREDQMPSHNERAHGAV